MSRPITDFESRVYGALKRVPSGKVVSYRQMADWLGIKSAQAIGQALKRNPNAPQVPCHRVVRADGSLGGYQGATSLSDPSLIKKVELLRSEGVEFDADGRLIDRSLLIG